MLSHVGLKLAAILHNYLSKQQLYLVEITFFLCNT